MYVNACKYMYQADFQQQLDILWWFIKEGHWAIQPLTAYRENDDLIQPLDYKNDPEICASLEWDDKQER